MKKYRINEIFYSLQGEGFWSGRPAVFVRFSGCNLKCPFCDTSHSAFVEMTAEEIAKEVCAYNSDFVVLTGGEPTLFVDDALVDILHENGKYIAVETNGTHLVSPSVDWITLSPKDCFVDNALVVLKEADEVKLVFDGTNAQAFEKYAKFKAKHYFLQPCDCNNCEKNNKILQDAIAYCLEHPLWSLSLQIHKMLGVR